MESRTPPSTVDALEPVQPTGYHGDPPPDLPRLRKRMVEVLRTFRRKDTVFRDTSGFCNWGGAPIREGFTDEELVPQVHQDALSKNVDAKLPSPSGIRTARKDLERAGLVEKAGTLRPTSLGNQAYVFRLTQAGRDFELPQ